MFHLLNKSTELGLIFDWKKTVWEDTVGYAKQFRRDSEIYLMTVLSDFLESKRIVECMHLVMERI